MSTFRRKDFDISTVEIEVRGETQCEACRQMFEFWKKKSWGNWKPKFCPECIRIDRQEGGPRSKIIR